MTTFPSAARIAAALLALLLLAPGFGPPALAEDPPDDPPKKRGFFFNRLRGGEEKPEEAPGTEEVTKKKAKKAEEDERALEAEARDGAPPGGKIQDTVDRVRRSAIGTEPGVEAYLQRIERGHATAGQLNDFASFLVRRGAAESAVVFQNLAVDLEPGSTPLWVNLGTIQQARGKIGSARAAYRKALKLDPTNALAHYGLGVAADDSGDYDGAIEHYRRALLIDPNLADPKHNPQAVNNERLLVVQLLIARERAGALGLPLLPGTPERAREGGRE